MGLNQAQKEATSHNKGPCMVLAGPGSGKTLTIAKRIEYLIQKHKVRPEEILVITFTKLASKEMKNRYKSLAGQNAGPVTFGTFHGIYYGILKWAYKLGSENILSEEEKMAMLKQCVIHLNADIEEDQDFYKDLSGEIGMIKNNQEDINTYQASCCQDEIFRDIYRSYETERSRRKRVDFDDMLVLCHDLFVKRPDILKLWQQKFKYILVDEFQDINKVQYEVLKMLAAPENNLFIVGDDDQSIYRFRGARPDIMLGFQTDYHDAKQVLLDVNYRSTKAIVNGSQRVIANNKTRYPKKIITTNEQGCTVHIQEVLHPVEESKYVAGEIQKALKDGILPEDIAILFRTNTEARALIETCMEYHIPFRMKEHIPNLYDHFIGQDIQAYLRLSQGPRDRKDFLRVMNRPNRYIGRECVEGSEVSFQKLKTFYSEREWMQDRIDQLDVDLRMIKNMAPYAAIQYIRKKIGYDEFLKEYADFRKIQMEDLKEILMEIEERSKTFKTQSEWFLHIQDYTNRLRQQSTTLRDQPNAVTLLTMHASKGLEYHTVFIIGANESITPYKKAQTPEELEEERRMFYVAMTRAKKRLTITYTKEKNGKSLTPSRFTQELLTIQ